MEPQLEALQVQFDAIRDDAKALTAGLSHTQLLWRPQPGAWSITHCLAHLNLINGQDLAQFFRAITIGRKQGRTAAGPFRWNWFERWFISTMEPPVRGMKFKAPKIWRPEPEPDPVETQLEFERQHNDLHFLMGESDGLDLKSIRLPSPAVSWLKMSIGSRFHLLAAHDRRHLWQARRVREQPGFPA